MEDSKEPQGPVEAPSETGRFPYGRLLWFLAAAAAIAASAYGLISRAKVWDRPATKPQTITNGDFAYDGNSIHVSIVCDDCPVYLVESHPVGVELTFILEKSATPNLQGARRSAPGPSSTSNIPSEGHSATARDLNASSPGSWVSVWTSRTDADFEFQGNVHEWDLVQEKELATGTKHQTTLPAVLNPPRTGTLRVGFHFEEWNRDKATWGKSFEPSVVDWQPDVRPTFLAAAAPFLYAGVVFGLALAAFLLIDRRFRQLRMRTEQRLLEVRNRAVDRPDNGHFAWESARIKLEAYFDRNLIQVNLVFWLAALVMAVGFGFVLGGVFLALRNHNDFSTAALAAISGIITQFIGATFLVIYRSTMRQANDFMSVLERINTVGMAVHELDRIPEDQKELKNEVRAHLVQSLVGGARSSQTQDEDGDER